MTRVALITGASRGLGRALCLRYLGDSFEVIGVSRSAPNDDLRQQEAFTWLRGDLTGGTAYRQIEQHLAELSSLQLLINCAGAACFGPVDALDFPRVQAMASLNLVAPIALTALCTKLLSNTRGTVVNILSTAALRFKEDEAAYCATKYGLKAFSESARKEFVGLGVRVISVFPGGMDTSLWNEPAAAGRRPENALDPQAVAEQIWRCVDAPSNSSCDDLIIHRVPKY